MRNRTKINRGTHRICNVEKLKNIRIIIYAVFFNSIDTEIYKNLPDL